MTDKMKKSKNAQIPSVFTDLMSLFFVIFLILIFAFLFKLGSDGKQAEIDNRIGTANANTVLINYLKFPVDTGNGEISIAELINLYYLKQAESDAEGLIYKRFLYDNTTAYFRGYGDANLNWALKISNNDLIKQAKPANLIGYYELALDKNSMIKGVQFACLLIPASDGESIKVEFIFSEQTTDMRIIGDFRRKRGIGDFDC